MDLVDPIHENFTDSSLAPPAPPRKLCVQHQYHGKTWKRNNMGGLSREPSILLRMLRGVPEWEEPQEQAGPEAQARATAY